MVVITRSKKGTKHAPKPQGRTRADKPSKKALERYGDDRALALDVSEPSIHCLG